jgi:hypothetical protein
MAISKIVANSVDLDGAITINESSNSVDFRVESNGNTHQLFVDGSGDNVGIGTTPNAAASLHIKGTGNGLTRVEHASNGAYVDYKYDGPVSSGDLYFTATGANVIDMYTGGGSRLKIDGSGHVTMPQQTSFLVKPDANQDGLSINTYHTVQFDEEVLDTNADFNTSTYTFTAPVTGKYQLNMSVYLYNIDKDADYILISIDTSNRTYSVIFDPGGYAADINYQSWVQTVVADMDASDTAVVKVYQQAGAAQSNLIAGNYTWFSGYLVA